jgi:serine/threonine-protein kinase
LVGSIDRKPEEQDRTRLLAASRAMYASTGPASGALLYLRASTLVAHPFDVRRLVFTGDAVPIVEGVGNFGALGFFSTGGNAIAYRTGNRVSGGRESQLTWLDRGGKPIREISQPNAFDGIRLSPDGTRAAVVLVGPAQAGLGNVDVWIVDLTRGVPQRLTTHSGADRITLWSPTGDRVIFSSNRTGVMDLYVSSSTADTAIPLFASSEPKTPTSWSSDARFVLFNTTGVKTRVDIWVLPLEGDRKPIALVQTGFAEFGAQFSPDMKWIAYTSDASGRSEIYVRSFNAASPASSPDDAVVVSRDGGTTARWVRNGRELVFQTADGGLAAVDIHVEGGKVRPGTPVELFTLSPGAFWDVTADGKQFLVTMPTVEAGLAPINVLLNWSLK